jgi:hypothetical protein
MFMRKLFATTFTLSFLSLNAYASSTITLPLPSDKTIKANATAELKLDALTSDVPYKVTCELESPSPTALDMSYTPQLAPNGGFGVTTLNGKAITNNVMRIEAGQNTFSFLASVADNKNPANSLLLKNLDDRYNVTLKSCQANPVANVTAAANLNTLTRGGYFYVTNRLGYYLDINVGNYVPTGYCIPPNFKQYVSVSTDNQNIEIVGLHH